MNPSDKPGFYGLVLFGLCYIGWGIITRNEDMSAVGFIIASCTCATLVLDAVYVRLKKTKLNLPDFSICLVYGLCLLVGAPLLALVVIEDWLLRWT